MVIKCNATVKDNVERKKLFDIVKTIASSYSEINQTVHMTLERDNIEDFLDVVSLFESYGEHEIQISS